MSEGEMYRMTIAPECKGSYWLGSACGQCKRCQKEAMEIAPRLVAYHKRGIEASDFLDALAIACEKREAINPVLVGGTARLHADRLRPR